MDEEGNEELSKPGETPRDRFRRLATLRVNEILKRFKILGNCANRRNYEYDQKDVYKMFEVIEKKMEETKRKFFDAQEKEFTI